MLAIMANTSDTDAAGSASNADADIVVIEEEVTAASSGAAADEHNIPHTVHARAPCWKFFSICSHDNTKAECKECNKVYSRGKKGEMGTSNLKTSTEKS